MGPEDLDRGVWFLARVCWSPGGARAAPQGVPAARSPLTRSERPPCHLLSVLTHLAG